MSETDLHRDLSAGGEAPAMPKRRKVRKGTQSCWECKRRKTRCTFAAPTGAVCDGCRSRRTKCIKQEFRDDAATASSKVDRISRVEILVEKLVQDSSANMVDMLPQDEIEPDNVVEYAVRAKINSFAVWSPI